MKKRVLLVAAFLLSIGGGAWAVVTGDTTTYSATLRTELKGQLSNNVLYAYTSSADNSGYSAGTYHNKGTRTFASSSGDAALYYSITTATAIPAAPSGTDTANFDTATWTKI